MNAHAATAIGGFPASSPDLAASKRHQQGTWAAGDYSVIGTTLQIVGESLCEAAELLAGERVLDVAAGDGNATLAAARRFAEVTSTDYVAALLVRSHERAIAERLPVKFLEADAEALPFSESSFDVVLSSFGAMFTPDQEQAASEMMRVVRPGGRIAMANWTPGGFIGELQKTIEHHVPPPTELRSSTLWGTVPRLRELFPGCNIQAALKTYNFRYRSVDHWLNMFRTFYGPIRRSFAALDAGHRKALEQDLRGLIATFNRNHQDSVVVPSEYLEAIVFRR